MSSLLNYKKIDVSKMKLDRDENRKVTYYLKYNDHDVLVKTPQVQCQGELMVDEEIAYLDIEIPQRNKDFNNMFHTVDTYILNYVSKEQELPRYRVEENFKPSIMQRNGKTFVRVRLPLTKDGQPVTKIFDVNGTPIDTTKHELKTLLRNGDKLMLLISPEKIRISKNTIKCNWYVQQMKINRKITDCLLSDSDDDDDDEESNYESESDEGSDAN